ncbi:MAG: 2-hydroxyacid dehydrogenase [Ruminococcaceae bacterium]|nr:2-hydroxyacid dehydrogenase [Oscillospiraceae bacterium]
MKIAFFDSKPYDEEVFSGFSTDNLSMKFFETKLNEDTVSLAKGFDCICAFVNDTVNSNVIDALCDYGIKLIALRCAGYNNVDINYAKNKISVVRVPAYSPYAVAEHTMALLLTAVRNTHKAYVRTKSFNFSLNGLVGFDLYGKTVGIIGTGKIGRVFSDICKGFGMKILAYDKYPNGDLDIKYTSLENLFKESDIISLHCPLNDESYHLINKDNISLMKNGVILVNTSRGALVDSDALLEGIRSKKIGGACLDVYEEESELFFEDNSNLIINDDTLALLMTMPNVIVTSHQAFFTKEALSNIANTTIENINEFYTTGKCKNEVTL